MVDTQRVAQNLRHIAAFEAKPSPRQLPETAVTRGFEKVAFPKLVRELQDPNLVVRQKALLAARELLSSPVNHVQCIAAGATPALVALLGDPDDTVRQRAAGTMRLLVNKELGARDLIQYGGVEALVQSLEDAVEGVRDEAYGTLVEAARFEPTRRTLERLGDALPRVLALALMEAPGPRAAQGLRILNACAQVRHNEGVLSQLIDAAGAVAALTGSLLPAPGGAGGHAAQQHILQQRQQAAELLAALASRDDAKLQAVSVGAVAVLLGCLSVRHVTLATAASSALAAITVAREGKYAVVEAQGGLSSLVGVLDPSNEQLCINTMVALANVAEAPEARPVLATCGAEARLAAIFEGATSEVMRRGAAHAMRQCRFKNWPYEVLPGAQLQQQQ